MSFFFWFLFLSICCLSQAVVKIVTQTENQVGEEITAETILLHEDNLKQSYLKKESREIL